MDQSNSCKKTRTCFLPDQWCESVQFTLISLLLSHEEIVDCNNLDTTNTHLTPDLDSNQPNRVGVRSEVVHAVCKARATSAPGPNGVPYRHYRNAPEILIPLETDESHVAKEGDISILV